MTFPCWAEHENRLIVTMLLQDAVQLVVKGLCKHEVVCIPTPGDAINKSRKFARSEFFTKLPRNEVSAFALSHDHSVRSQNVEQTSLTVAGPSFARLAIQSATSMTLGTVAETTMNLTAFPRSFMRETTTSRVLPRDSLSRWTCATLRIMHTSSANNGSLRL